MISELLQDNKTNAVRINPRLKSLFMTPSRLYHPWSHNVPYIGDTEKLCKERPSLNRQPPHLEALSPAKKFQAKRSISIVDSSEWRAANPTQMLFWISILMFCTLFCHHAKPSLKNSANLVQCIAGINSKIVGTGMQHVFFSVKKYHMTFIFQTEGISSNSAATTLVPSAKILSWQRLESQDHKGLGQSTTASSHTENQWFRKDELNT